MSSIERTRVNRKKTFCRKTLKELAVKAYKSTGTKLGTDGERRRAGRTWGTFSGAGEGWKEVLTRAEGACEVPVKVLGVSWR